MSTFEALHPRGGGGRFTNKSHSAPSLALSAPAPVEPVFEVQTLDAPDPAGGFDMSVDAPTGRRYLADGKLHRLDGPAYVGKDGTQEWYVHGELHRDGGPAVVADGGEEWYDHGRLTRQVVA